MSDDLEQTVRIVREKKVTIDDRGRTVWNVPIESAELELVSTVELKKILSSDDGKTKRRIAEAAQGKDGVLARDVKSKRFEIIDDDTLNAALASAADTSPESKAADVVLEAASIEPDQKAEELSLVSTQMLRTILDEENPGESPILVETGIDPYNSS